MGMVNTKQYDGKRFSPTKKWVPFPRDLMREPGKVIASFMAVPPLLNKKVNVPDNAEWYVDCKFWPYTDNHLITNLGVYIPRPGRTSLTVSTELKGAMCVWKLTDKINCRHIRGTKTTATPNIVIHPDAENVAYLANGFLNLKNLVTDRRISKDKDMSNFPFVHCAISPNGLFIAYVKRKQQKYEMGILMKEQILINIHTIFCNEWCPEFKSNGSSTDEVECCFSPDSLFLAVGISKGLLMVVKRFGLRLAVPIIPGMFSIEGMRLVNTRSFEFHPRYHNRYLTFGGDDNIVYFLDIELEEVVHKTELEESVGEIACIKYNESGDMLAVATTSAQIFILSSDDGSIMQRLDGSMQDEMHAMVAIDNLYPTFISLSFNQAGTVLSSSSSDGFVRLWQIQPNINLQKLCRLAILRKVRVSNLKNLPLPPKIIHSLLQWPE